jgi:broad specificity phosphatase PhoE
MPTVKILRHSERLDYANPLLWMVCFGQKWDDAPLTEHGHQIANQKGQALVDGKDFNPKKIYTSPYRRTMSTASSIRASFPEAEIIVETLLSEYQPNKPHLIDLYPHGISTYYNGQQTNFCYPETHDEFKSRAHFIVDQLVIANTNDFAIITHGELLKVFIAYFKQTYPDVLFESDAYPSYLCTLSFTYDADSKQIDGSSIRLE